MNYFDVFLFIFVKKEKKIRTFSLFVKNIFFLFIFWKIKIYLWKRKKVLFGKKEMYAKLYKKFSDLNEYDEIDLNEY